MTEDSRKHMLTFKSESVIRHHILQFTTDFAIRSSAQRNHAVLCTQQQIQTFFFCKELLDIPGGITRCRAKLFRWAIEVLMCWSSKFILDIDLSNEATKLRPQRLHCPFPQELPPTFLQPGTTSQRPKVPKCRNVARPYFINVHHISICSKNLPYRS